MLNLSGIYPPVPTNFNAAGDLELNHYQSNIRRLTEAGVHGVVLLGSNGEYVYLSDQEKLDTIRAGLAALPPGKLGLVGTGCESTRATVWLTQEAAKLGADAALVINPNYYKPMMTKQVLLTHYRAVADASPIPVVLYSMPRFTGLDIPVDVVAELSQHPNIAGIKDSAGNVIQLHEVLLKSRPGFNVLVGTGSALLAALSIGATGGVLALADVAPADSVRLFELCRQGDWEAARALQSRLLPVNAAVTGAYGIPGLKAAMDLLGYYGGPPRQPLLPVGDKERAALQGVLATAGLL